jgi:hypothetical protein
MNDLATRGLRRTERLGRLGLWGLLPRPVYHALAWSTFSGLPLPPPLREGQMIALELDAAVNAVLEERLAHPTDSTCSTCCFRPTAGRGRGSGSATRR